MQIGGQNFTDDILDRIRSQVREVSTLTRTALSRDVCDWMGWGTYGSNRLIAVNNCRFLILPGVCVHNLASEVPDSPCTVYFEEAEWKALMVFTNRNPIPPATPPTLREATRRVASSGGFLERKCDGEPGTQSLCLPLERGGTILPFQGEGWGGDGGKYCKFSNNN